MTDTRENAIGRIVCTELLSAAYGAAGGLVERTTQGLAVDGDVFANLGADLLEPLLNALDEFGRIEHREHAAESIVRGDAFLQLELWGSVWPLDCPPPLTKKQREKARRLFTSDPLNSRRWLMGD